jgi:hypothetical protein
MTRRKRAEVDLELLVDAVVGLRRAAVAGQHELAPLDLQRDLGGIDAGELGLHDGARGGGLPLLVEDVDGREKPPPRRAPSPGPKTSPKSSSISRRIRSKFAKRSRSGRIRPEPSRRAAGSPCAPRGA